LKFTPSPISETLAKISGSNLLNSDLLCPLSSEAGGRKITLQENNISQIEYQQMTQWAGCPLFDPFS